MYNGRDGVVTDDNGLIYMRARYYSPELRRFVNVDIIAGKITNAITLNRYAYANANPVSFVDPQGLSVERGLINNFDYSMVGWISPWGNPNTHVTQFDKYWLERWYGSDGRAIRDRHWSDHGSPKKHTIPHEQEWDWSDPNHPKLAPGSKPPSDPPTPPTSKGEEPWEPENSKESSNDDKQNKSEQSSSVGNALAGIAILISGSVAIAWLLGNDATGLGAADDAAIIPIVEFLGRGMQLILGT